MAEFLKLYVDTQSNRLVKSSTQTDAFTLPTFYQGDIIPVRLYLLEPNTTGGIASPYSIITESKSVSIALVTPHQTSGSEVVHASLTFSTFDSSTGAYTGNLSLNTTEITTLLGSSTSATTYFEVQVTGGGIVSTELQTQVTVRADGIKAASATPVGAESYYTQAQADGVFVKFDNRGRAGSTIVLTSPDGTWGRLLGVDNDGYPRDEIITIT